MIKPNHLTIIGLTLGVVAVFTQPTIALILFTASFALDLTDGWLARKTKQATKFGGLLDSTSDKVIEVLFIYYISNLMGVQSLGILAAGASIMVSYAKHRAGIKMRTVFDRAQRIIFLLAIVILFNQYAVIAYLMFITLSVIAITQVMVRAYAKN